MALDAGTKWSWCGAVAPPSRTVPTLRIPAASKSGARRGRARRGVGLAAAFSLAPNTVCGVARSGPNGKNQWRGAYRSSSDWQRRRSMARGPTLTLPTPVTKTTGTQSTRHANLMVPGYVTSHSCHGSHCGAGTARRLPRRLAAAPARRQVASPPQKCSPPPLHFYVCAVACCDREFLRSQHSSCFYVTVSQTRFVTTFC
jgi:hypothetical protein